MSGSADTDLDALMKRGPVTPDRSTPSAPTADASLDTLMSSDPNATPPPPGMKSGIIANAGAGTSDTVASYLGAPVDLTTAAINAGVRGVNAVTGAHIPQIDHPLGGSDTFKSAEGLVGADPRDVAATTSGEKLARSIGDGAAGMVLPWAGARALPALSGIPGAIQEAVGGGSAATQAGIGAASGAGSYAGGATAAALGGEGARPYGELAGSLLGAAAPTGIHIGASAILPGSVETQAADAILSAAKNPEAVRSTLQSPADELVPGSPATLGQATNDSGILERENYLRTKQPERFRDIANAQNAARVDALTGFSEPGADAGTASQFFRDRLDELTQQGDQQVAGAQNAYDTAAAKIGGTALPEQTGAVMQGEIAKRYAAPQQAAQALEQVSAARAQRALDAASPPVAATDEASARQQLGAPVRAAVQGAADARKAQVDRLWDIARQNGDIKFDPEPVQEALATVGGKGYFSENSGDVLNARESQLVDTLKGWTAPQDYESVTGAYTNVNSLINQLQRAGGDARTVRRLMVLKTALNDTLEHGLDGRIQAERAAVSAGTLDPDATFEANLAANRDRWVAARQGGERRYASTVADRPESGGGSAGSGPVAVSGGSGTAGQAGELPPVSPGNPGVAPAVSADDVAARTAEARAARRDYGRVFQEGPTADVLERAPYGRAYDMGDSDVARQYFRSGPGAAERAQSYVEAVGDAPKARAALTDAAAYDLRQAAASNGELNPQRYRQWLAKHDEALSVFPEVRQKFDTAAAAQEQLNVIREQRLSLDKAYQNAISGTPSQTAAAYWKKGAQGSEAAKTYAVKTGGTQEAADALHEQAAYTLRQEAMRNGALDDRAYQNWKRAYGPALAQRPDIAAQFDTFAKARNALTEAIAGRADAIKAYENSAARFWLRNEPEDAVAKAFQSGVNTKAALTDMMAQMRGDAAAQASVRQNVLDYIMRRMQTNVEAGDTGTLRLKSDAFQNFVKNNHDALGVVFKPEQVSTLEKIAEDMQRSNRSVAGSAPLIGPGTARDLSAVQRFGSKTATFGHVLLHAGAKLGALAAGHYLDGLEGVLGASMGVDSAKSMVHGMRQARLARVEHLMTDAILDPGGKGRLLIQKATPSDLPSIGQQYARRLGQGALAYAGRYQAQPPAQRGISEANQMAAQAGLIRQ